MRGLVLLLLLTVPLWAQPSSRTPFYEVRGVGRQQVTSTIGSEGKLTLLLNGRRGVRIVLENEEWPGFKAAVQRAMKKAPKMKDGEWATLWTQEGDRWSHLEVLAGRHEGMPVCLFQLTTERRYGDPVMAMIQERRFAALAQWLEKTATFFQ